MAQDHFKTPPDPKRGYKRPQKSQKSLKVRAKPAKVSRMGLADYSMANKPIADTLG